MLRMCILVLALVSLDGCGGGTMPFTPAHSGSSGGTSTSRIIRKQHHNHRDFRRYRYLHHWDFRRCRYLHQRDFDFHKRIF